VGFENRFADKFFMLFQLKGNLYDRCVSNQVYRTRETREKMRRQPLSMVLLVIALVGTSLMAAEAADAPTGLRVGVYDSRAVALAYGRCGEFQARIATLRADHSAAEAAGDSARVKELETEGPWLQERMHMQVFGNLPIDDILEGRDELIAEVARATGVDVIVPSVAWSGEGVEIVDVTEAFATQFEVDEQTLEMVRQMKDVEPVQLPFDFGDE